jgi:hypothetical protein
MHPQAPVEPIDVISLTFRHQTLFSPNVSHGWPIRRDRVFRGIPARLLFGLRVDHRAEQNHQRRYIKLGEQDDDTAQRSVGFVIAIEVGDIYRKANRSDQPKKRRNECAR